MNRMTTKHRQGSVAYFVSLTLAAASMAVAGAAVAGPGPLPPDTKPGVVCLDTEADGLTPLSAAACAPGRTVGTYYANSPILPKFVDPLPGLMAPTDAAAPNTPHIPLALPDTSTYPGSHYYVMGVVEYSQQMHSSLPKETTLRGYVQLYPQGATTHGANAYPLTYPDGTAIKWPNSDEQVVAYEKPHYLGPIVVAEKGVPVRMLMMNFLPAGRGAQNGNEWVRNGDLFLPVDESLGGAGATTTAGETFAQNRVSIHLHGGDSPWISDGTPHQWFIPGNDPSSHKIGASLKPVPDMPPPPPGGETIFWPNDQSARFMWFHDHTFGLTRQNAYAGMATGYLITDPAEDAALGITDYPLLPLVLQDKTFVPTDIATQDAKWDVNKWGKPGDLWMPHVYEVNETETATPEPNPAGRWDFGPQDTSVAFTPILDRPNGDVDQPSTTPEMFNDTPVINGVAYPKVTVEPRPYRVRMLNGSNDRYLNLSLYVADPDFTSPVPGAGNTEVRMMHEPAPVEGITLTDPGSTYVEPVVTITDAKGLGSGAMASAVLVGGVITGITLDSPGAGYVDPVVTITDASGPGTGATATATLLGGREGGIPDSDPTLAGPDIVQFGTEAGLLPTAVVHAPAPINLNDAGEVVSGGLYLGTAERADTIIDFSQYAGKTLILYNDSPSPVPGGDPRYDYFTGDPDQTRFGGAPSTVPGYGPNVRTIMQINVTAAAAGTPTSFDAITFSGLVSARHAASIAVDEPMIATNVAAPGEIAFDGTTLTVNGTTQPVQIKTIQGGYDVNFGRLIANFGADLGDANGPTPIGYIDPPTEIINPGDTQYWVLRNIDADNHPVHFHLFNVQVLGRRQTDGTIRAPLEMERGWKETVQSWPGEDLIVALRPKTPLAPFGLANSVRLLDPSLAPGATQPHLNYPAGATAPEAFLQVDLSTGAPAATPVTNSQQDFGWEYVWHCHILGHEENDLMRPMVFNAVNTQPGVPTDVGVNAGTVTWTDPTPIGAALTKGNTSNEYGFRVERTTVVDGIAGSFAPLGAPQALWADNINARANSESLEDLGAGSLDANTDYAYRVVAVNQASAATSNSGESVSAAYVVHNTPLAPSALTAGTPIVVSGTADVSVGLSWTDNSTNEDGFVIARDGTDIQTVSRNTTSWNDTLKDVSTAAAHTYTVRATNDTKESAVSAGISVTPVVPTPAAPTTLAATPAVAANSTVDVPLTWVDNATNETGYEVLRDGVVVATIAANRTSYTDNLAGISASTTFNYAVHAKNVGGTSADATLAVTPPVPPPQAPSGLNGSTQLNSVNSSAFVVLRWNDNADNETGYTVTRTAPAGLPVVVGTLPAGSTVFADQINNITAATTYSYAVTATNVGGSSAAATTAITVQVPAPLAPTAVTATSTTAAGTGVMTVNLAWLDNATNEASYTVTRTSSAGGAPVVTTLVANTKAFKDTLAKPLVETTYTYVVAAVNTGGTSAATPVTVKQSAALPGTPAVQAPVGVKNAILNTAAVTLNWTDVANETSYQVKRGATVLATLPAGSTSYVDTTLPAFTSKTAITPTTYTVSAINNLGTANGTASYTPGVTLAAPTNLSTTYVAAVGATAAGYQLNWTDNSFAESGYYVQRSDYTANATTGALAWTAYTRVPTATSTLATNLQTYLDTSAGVATSPLHRYQVLAVNGALLGAVTTSVDLNTGVLMAGPTGLKSGGGSTTTSIPLGWTKTTSLFATGYEIQICTGKTAVCNALGATWTSLPTVAGSATVKAAAAGLVTRTTYSFRIRAINSAYPALNSVWSAPVQLATK